MWSFIRESLVVVFRCDFPETYKGDVNCLAIGLSRKLVLLVLILEVADIVVADADRSIVLAIELTARLRQIDHLIDVSHFDSSRITLNELILRE